MTSIVRICKDLIKWNLVQVTRWRLRRKHWSQEAADQWAERIKLKPGIWSGLEFSKRVTASTGMVMDVGLQDVIERTILATGTWDRPVQQVIAAYLKPGDVFYDIGANIGYFTLFASKQVGPQGAVYAFEPSLRALRKLVHHLRLNQVSNVHVLSIALGNENGCSRIQLAPESNIGGSRIMDDASVTLPTEPILIHRLDDLPDTWKRPPTLIKMDVEGFEMNVLWGAEQFITRYHPAVVCELTDQFLASHQVGAADLVAWMEQRGYQTYQLKERDGRMIASRLTETPRDQIDVLFAYGEPRVPVA